MALAKGGANIEYLGFNCTTPEYITQALEALSPVVRKQLAVLGITLGVSPNFNDIEVKHRAGFDISKIKKTGGGSAGAGVHKVVKREDMVGGKWVNFAAKWHQLGVTCIGACCGSVPDDIKAMAEHVGKHTPPHSPVPARHARHASAIGGRGALCVLECSHPRWAPRHLSQGAGCEGGGTPQPRCWLRRRRRSRRSRQRRRRAGSEEKGGAGQEDDKKEEGVNPHLPGLPFGRRPSRRYLVGRCSGLAERMCVANVSAASVRDRWPHAPHATS